MALNDGEAFQCIAKRCLDAFSEDAPHIAAECASAQERVGRGPWVAASPAIGTLVNRGYPQSQWTSV